MREAAESPLKKPGFHVYINPVDYPYPDELRLNVWLVEHGVMGHGKGWDQFNYFSGNNLK